jgi:hypothetical protein
MSTLEDQTLMCGHLVTHIAPEIDQLMKEMLNVDFSIIAQMTEEDWARFGQLGIQAKWVIDNIEKIEEIYGNIIDSQKVWNDAVAKLSKKGFGVLETIDKNAVDLAIALSARKSKSLEGEDRKTNAIALQGDLRRTNNEIDQARNGMTLASKIAELDRIKEQALTEPDVQRAIAAWKEWSKQRGVVAKMSLQHGLAVVEHPKFPGNDGTFSGVSEDWGQYVNVPQTPRFGQSKQPMSIGGSANRSKDSLSFSAQWSGDIAAKVKGFGSNIAKGGKKIGKWFGS